MTGERIDDPDAESDGAGGQRARGQTGHRSPSEGVLREPHGAEPGLLGRPSLGGAFPGLKSSVDAESDAGSLFHGRPAQMSPGRGSRLAWEKCTCTVFQPLGSLTITMVDRETNGGRSTS